MLLLLLSMMPAAEPPDVILIVIDTLRADHLGHYGYALATDPGLRSLNDGATRFTRCYAPAPWTGPSVASLVTGLFTSRHRTKLHGDALPDDAVTLAMMLRDAGWKTFGISHNRQVSSATGHDRGFDDWSGYEGSPGGFPGIGPMLERTRAWLDEVDRRPFFVYLHPMDTHGPYATPERARAALLGRPPSDEFVYAERALPRQRDRGEPSEALKRSLVEQYDTAIRYATDRLGAFFDHLKRRGFYDSSLIVVTSDHGEELYDHGGVNHGFNLYEEVLHVPLWVKLPGQKEPRTVERTVSLIDIVPTVADVLGIRPELPLDGESLLDAPRRRVRLHETRWERRCVGRSIARGRYKLVEIDRDWSSDLPRTLLFDLERDPLERRDLSTRKPRRVRRLRSVMERRFAEFESWTLGDPASVLDRMDREKLRELGYAE